jgi:hypothetical protein
VGGAADLAEWRPSRLLAAQRKQTCYVQCARTPLFYYHIFNIFSNKVMKNHTGKNISSSMILKKCGEFYGEMQMISPIRLFIQASPLHDQ